jgi:hypothetical protein
MGGEQDVRDKLLNKPDEIIISREPYDWAILIASRAFLCRGGRSISRNG